MRVPAQGYIRERIVVCDCGHASPCWVWRLCKTGKGYGVAHWGGKVRAHRLSYTAFVGRIPDGRELDHLCHNPACVNPAHLEAVAPAENRRRQTRDDRCGGFVRDARNKTHCVHGHEFTPENTLTRKSGTRACRECLRRNWREWKQRQKNDGGASKGWRGGGREADPSYDVRTRHGGGF